jgi:hypothetical protein
MESIAHWITMDAPTSWSDVIVRFVKIALIAFVVLQIKELVDAGTFDNIAAATDALLIAAGSAVVNAAFLRTKPRHA